MPAPETNSNAIHKAIILLSHVLGDLNSVGLLGFVEEVVLFVLFVLSELPVPVKEKVAPARGFPSASVFLTVKE